MPRNTEVLGERVRRFILDQIRRRVWAPDTQVPSIRALAASQHVNPDTVRNAIQELVADRVLKTVQGKGTFVARVPVTWDPDDTFVSGILLLMPSAAATHAMLDMALERGLLVSHYHSDTDLQDPAAERKLLSMARRDRFMGAIVTPTPHAPTNHDLFREMRREGTKVLLTGHYAESMPDQAYLVPDFAGAARVATTRMVLAGYRHVVGVRSAWDEQLILPEFHTRGVREAVEELGLDTLPALRVGRPDRPGSAEAQARLLHQAAELPDRTALVCRNGWVASAVLDLLERAHRTVPDQVGVVYVRGMYHGISSPNTTRTEFWWDELADRAFRYITDASVSPLDAYQELLQPHFVQGETTLSGEGDRRASDEAGLGRSPSNASR